MTGRLVCWMDHTLIRGKFFASTQIAAVVTIPNIEERELSCFLIPGINLCNIFSYYETTVRSSAISFRLDVQNRMGGERILFLGENLCKTSWLQCLLTGQAELFTIIHVSVCPIRQKLPVTFLTFTVIH